VQGSDGSNGFPFEVGDDLHEYIHTDAIGSVRMVTGHAGVVLNRYDYRPFGEPWPAGSDAAPVGFAGSELDAELGNSSWLAANYMGARWLQAAIGRFTSVDPGHADGTLTDPQSWNGYAYVRNNPLAFVDPDGRQTYIVGAGDLVTGEGGGMSDEDRAIWSLISGRALADGLSRIGATVSAAVDALTGTAEVGAPEITRTTMSKPQPYAVAVPFVVLATAVVSKRVPALAGSVLPKPNLVGTGPAAKKLQNIIDALYKGTTNPRRVGTGTTADAIRHELANPGVSVGGKLHSQKGQDYARALENWLKANPLAPGRDRIVAQSLLNELRDALAGQP
jgi:RHS repeat-associated protein